MIASCEGKNLATHESAQNSFQDESIGVVGFFKLPKMNRPLLDKRSFLCSKLTNIYSTTTHSYVFYVDKVIIYKSLSSWKMVKALWFVIWLIILLIFSFWIAGFLAFFYIILYPITVCIPALSVSFVTIKLNSIIDNWLKCFIFFLIVFTGCDRLLTEMHPVP